MLSILPPEIRSKIYSHVFSTEDEGLVMLRVTQRKDLAGNMALAPYAILFQDPRYDRYRRRPKYQDKWPTHKEEAYYKGDAVSSATKVKADRLAASFTMD